MKLNSRTPPVKIAAADMLAISALPAIYAGLLLKWGMKLYSDGQPVSIGDAKAQSGFDEIAWNVFFDIISPFVDSEALQEDKIIVSAFARSVAHQEKVSATKARAARAKKAAAIIRKAAMIAEGRIKVEATQKAPMDYVTADKWDKIQHDLRTRGVSDPEIQASINRWKQEHDVSDVLMGLEILGSRKITKPTRYLETVLLNMRSSRKASIPEYKYINGPQVLKPRAVKRKIAVEPRHTWRLEGWTAKGHINGGHTVQERKQVWRNDSGTLTYSSPKEDLIDKIPTYEQDPGIYEID